MKNRKKRKKLTNKQKTVIWVALGLIVLVLIGMLVFSSVEKKKNSIVMSSGDLKLDNNMFAYFFWSEIHERYDREGGQAGPDLSLTLDVQMYDETTTWKEFLIADIVPRVQEQMSLYVAAQAEGFKMPAEYQAQYDETVENFRQIALDMKYENLNAYLVDTFGPNASEKTFKQYLQYTFTADAYANELFQRTEPTQEQVLEYYEMWQAQYEDGNLETAESDLHKDEFYNSIERAKTENPIEVYEENIVITSPHGAHMQTEEDHH